MEIKEAIEELITRGWDAKVKDGILYVSLVYKSIVDLNKQSKKVKEDLNDIGYLKTYGMLARCEE